VNDGDPGKKKASNLSPINKQRERGFRPPCRPTGGSPNTGLVGHLAEKEKTGRKEDWTCRRGGGSKQAGQERGAGHISQP